MTHLATYLLLTLSWGLVPSDPWNAWKCPIPSDILLTKSEFILHLLPFRMPQEKPYTSLKSEINKIAKLTRIQSGLPGAMRAVPVAALIVGGALKKIPGAPDLQKVILGKDESIALGAPKSSKATTESKKGDNVEKET